MNEQTIFTAALEVQPKNRAAFLDEACATTTALRQRAEKLLRFHNDASDLLQSPVEVIGGIHNHIVCEAPGTAIGPYKLLEQIGEGGFGVVFLAEQERPVRRKVALKVIKPGMD